MTAPEREEGFLARWSRRKREARKPPASVPEAPQDSPVERLPEETTTAERREAAEAKLPPIESLDEHSDYQRFLSPDVSEELRRLALRKLFHLPQFNVVDGLDDYADDYTVFEKVASVIAAKASQGRAHGDAEKAPQGVQQSVQSHDQPAEPSEQPESGVPSEPRPPARPPASDTAGASDADGVAPECES